MEIKDIDWVSTWNTFMNVFQTRGLQTNIPTGRSGYFIYTALYTNADSKCFTLKHFHNIKEQEKIQINQEGDGWGNRKCVPVCPRWRCGGWSGTRRTPAPCSRSWWRSGPGRPAGPPARRTRSASRPWWAEPCWDTWTHVSTADLALVVLLVVVP